MAAKTVELVQLVGSVAWTCSHLPDVDKISIGAKSKRLKQRNNTILPDIGRYRKKGDIVNTNLAVAVSSSLQPVHEKWYGW